MSRENLVQAFNTLLSNGQEVDNKQMEQSMSNLHQDRSSKGSSESVGEHFDNFTNWANDRQIIQNGNILAQGLKLVSEVGELADNLAKGRCTKDDIGDCCVVLNNLAQMQGLTLEECLAQAWEDIKNRTGTMNEHGVFIKSEDLGCKGAVDEEIIESR